jgi:uncharacterized membrane protein
MEKSRIAALVDGIFAVAMTLLVLDLKLPEGVKMSSDAEVWRQLLELTGRFSTYTLSFIVLGTFWIGHHSLFHFVRKVNRVLLWLNLLFLLFITLLPFSTNLLSAHTHLQIPIVVYGINLLLISLLARSAIRAKTRFSRRPKAAKATFLQKCSVSQSKSDNQADAFHLGTTPRCPLHCLPLAQSARIHAKRLKLSKFGSLEPDTSDTFVSSPPGEDGARRQLENDGAWTG